MNVPWTLEPDALRLAVKVTVRAKRDELSGIVTGADGRPALAVRLSAPPVDGAANKALRRFLSDLLSVPATDVTIRSGETSRLKILIFSGESHILAARLASILGL